MLTCVVCSLENQKCSRRFPFPTPVPACGPGGGAEEAPRPAVETKAAWAVRPGPRRAPAGRAESAHVPASGLSPGLVPSFRWSPRQCWTYAGPTAAAQVTPEVNLFWFLLFRLRCRLQSLACRWHRSFRGKAPPPPPAPGSPGIGVALVLRNVLFPWFMAFGSELSY